jgi:hypothetical protein
VIPRARLRPRDEDAPDPGQCPADRSEKLVTSQCPDEEVDDEDVGCLSGKLASRRVEVVRHPNLVMAKLEHVVQAKREILVVVEDQDSRRRPGIVRCTHSGLHPAW